MNRSLSLAVAVLLSIVAVSRADSSWIEFAGSYVDANAPANNPNPGSVSRLVLLPGQGPGQFVGQMSRGSAFFLNGSVDNGTLHGTGMQLQNRSQFDFTITTDGRTLTLSANGTQIQFVPEQPPGGQQIAPQGQPQNVPGWVTPGTRMVFRTRTAQVSTEQYAQWPDPAAEVQYPVDRAPADSTDGLTLCDILAIPGPQAVGMTTSGFMVMGMSNNGQPVLSPMPISGGVVPIMSANMIDPATLAKMQDNDSPQHKVTHRDYPFQGKTRQAVEVLSKIDQFYFDQVYDLKSGVCLHAGSTGASAMQVRGPDGKIVGSRPAVLLGLTDLVDVRTVHTPWSAAPAPQGFRGVKCMVYQGITTNQQIQQKSQSTTIMKFHDTTDACLPFVQYSAVQFQAYAANIPGVIMQPMVTRGLTASASLNPYAIDPTILGALQVGQVIDDDPAVGYKTSVVFVGQSDGRNVVVISEVSDTNPANPRKDSMYDLQTGLLIREKSKQLFTTTDMRLVGAD